MLGELIDNLRSLASKIEKTRAMVLTEEATKNAFVMPFIKALGYDVFDPSEVVPEMVADVGVKKGEKIDYAILHAGKPAILIECKAHEASLVDVHASQLYRYFSVTDCRVAILTNGIEYKVFSDLDNPNKLDSKPFLVFNLRDFDEEDVRQLMKFSKIGFDLDSVLSTAIELRYVREIKALLMEQLNSPSEDFVKFCALGVGAGRLTQAIREQFVVLARRALGEFINDRTSSRLKAALGASEHVAETLNSSDESLNDKAIETTVEELEGYYIVKAILREVADVNRVVYRDHHSYFAILADDNNRKPICRFRFGEKKKLLILFDSNRSEEKIEISSIDNIFAYSDRIRATMSSYG